MVNQCLGCSLQTYFSMTEMYYGFIMQLGKRLFVKFLKQKSLGKKQVATVSMGNRNKIASFYSFIF